MQQQDNTRARQLPAPRTIAPSREDVLSNLAFFFGDPAVPEKLRDYSEHHAMTYHFPDAYYGQNTKIRETLNNLILKSPQEWHTQVALPFVKIVGTSVEWDEIRFDVRLLQRVPYEGISRMSTSLRRRHRDRVVRRGIGLTIESDFYATEAGRAHFADQLTSIRYCVQETCNFDAIFAYLTCGNYDFRYDIQKGLRPRRSVRTAMANEINMYGIVQKDQMGLDKAVEEVKYRMSRYSVSPNMMIIPPQLSLYMALAPEQKLTYPLAGPDGPAAFNGGVQGFEAQSFRGLGVFNSTPYEVSDDQDSVQMLQRSTQIGEFYRMSAPAVYDPNTRLPPSYMDIMIYDEESDRHVHIPFEQALFATCYGRRDGGLDTGPRGDLFGLAESFKDPEVIRKFTDSLAARPFGTPVGTTKIDPALPGGSSFITALLAPGGVNTMPDTAAKMEQIGAAAATTPATTGSESDIMLTILSMVRVGVWLPIEIVIARPFIEHLMLSAVVAVSGRDTGATLFGPADMQISANTSVKTIEGHYTCHTKSVITKPQNVYVMRDIMCSGYVAGGNTRFFGIRNTTNGPASPADVRQQMDERLSFQDDAVSEYGSMLAFCAPYGDGAKRDQVISISERLLPWEVNGNDPEKRYFPGGNDNFKAYASEFGLNSIHFGEDVRASENMEFISQGSMNNSLCFVGPHRKYNPFSNQYHELVPGQGHFGPDAIPGDARWRRGEAVSLKAARDNMVSLEAAAHAQMFMTKRM